MFLDFQQLWIEIWQHVHCADVMVWLAAQVGSAGVRALASYDVQSSAAWCCVRPVMSAHTSARFRVCMYRSMYVGDGMVTGREDRTRRKDEKKESSVVAALQF
jgi:uncharacterized protein YceK